MRTSKKFKIIFLTSYSVLFLVIFMCAVFIDNDALRYFNAILIITWFPIIVVLVSTGLLQAKAGNFYKYLLLADKEKAKDIIKQHSSIKFFESKELDELLEKDYLPRIRSVSHKSSEDGTKVYKIKTNDGGAYLLTYIKRTEENAPDTNDSWIVNNIEHIPYKP